MRWSWCWLDRLCWWLGRRFLVELLRWLTRWMGRGCNRLLLEMCRVWAWRLVIWWLGRLLHFNRLGLLLALVWRLLVLDMVWHVHGIMLVRIGRYWLRVVLLVTGVKLFLRWPRWVDSRSFIMWCSIVVRARWDLGESRAISGRVIRRNDWLNLRRILGWPENPRSLRSIDHGDHWLKLIGWWALGVHCFAPLLVGGSVTKITRRRGHL